MNNFFKISILVFLNFINFQLHGYGIGCQWYGDEFGALQTGYTMGDLVRYTATPGLNVYSKMVVAPTGASDIARFGQNTYNLYNTLGYLYAGWALFNSSNFTNSSKWVTSYRTAKGGAREEFDNNYQCENTIEFPVTSTYQVVKKASIGTEESELNAQGGNDKSLKGLANFRPIGGDSTDSFATITAHYWGEGHDNFIDNTSTAASASCGWCSNASSGDMIMYFVDPALQKYEQVPLIAGPNEGIGIAGGRVYPTGQFFGARIAHILGAVVNDVPGLSATVGGTGKFNSPLISGSQGATGSLPTIAVMKGNTAGWTINGSGSTATSNAPAGMFQPSTAHFGSMHDFLKQTTRPKILMTDPKLAYNYLELHMQPMVKHLSGLCSYAMSTTPQNLQNLIEIQDSAVTSYDNGIVVAIQNNTGDVLQMYQGTAVPANQIGNLVTGNNNYYIHTASLMAGQTAPDASQMISIIDSAANVVGGTYIQILSATQLQALYEAIDKEIGTVISGGELSYNQIMPTNYVVPSDVTPAYVVVTNFDPSFNSSGVLNVLATLPSEQDFLEQILLSWRIQAINVAEFYQKPYLLSMQINKENTAYGVKTNYKQTPPGSGNYVTNTAGGYIVNYSLSSGAPNTYILYPSIMTANVYTWQNYLHAQKNQGQQLVEHYSYMPLLMLPQNVLDNLLDRDAAGLSVYYTIWLMSYAAAMTECSYNGAAFGNTLNIYDKVFNLFSFGNKFTVEGSATSQLARLVVDGQGVLESGKMVQLNGISLCGCDTFDSGGGFNQDIPIVNFINGGQDVLSSNNIVLPNKLGAKYVNLIATFGDSSINNNSSQASAVFNQLYGFPYSNSMIFSIATQALKDGVIVELSSSQVGSYQLIVTSTKDYSDKSSSNTIKAGSILAAPKVSIDTTLYNNTNLINLGFLQDGQDATWSSVQKINYNVQKKFRLQYRIKGKNNFLQLSNNSKKASLSKKILKSNLEKQKEISHAPKSNVTFQKPAAKQTAKAKNIVIEKPVTESVVQKVSSKGKALKLSK